MDPEIKKALDALRAELGKNVEAIARVDAIEKTATTGAADVKVIRAELDKVKADVVARENEIKDLQQRNRVEALRHDPISDKKEAQRMLGIMARHELCRALRMELPAEFKEEATILRDYMVKRATLESGAVTGSYLVPTVTESSIIDALEEVSDLLNRVDFIPGLPAAGTLYLPTLTTRPTLQAARASVDTAMTQSDPAFGRVTVSPAEAYVYFPIDNKLLQMSAMALGGLLMTVLRDGIIEGICNWLLVGDGTSTYNSITGILKCSTAAYVSSLPSGKMAFADLEKAHLTTAKAKTLKRGRARGVWLMSLEVMGLVEDLNREGKTPVITYAQDGTPRIMQNEVVIDEGMPDLADSAKSTGFIGFGDLATYLVGMVGGIQIAQSSDYLFGKNQTAFRGVVNMDIQRKAVATFMLMKTAAA